SFGFPNTFWIVAETPLLQPEQNVDADERHDGVRIVKRVVGQTLSPSRGAPTLFRGRYENVDYGFRVDVPTGFTGEGSVPPAPNHGFAVNIDAESVVWVDASYEMSEAPHRFRRFNARLGKLEAERKSWSVDKSGTKLFHDSIVARGFDRR